MKSGKILIVDDNKSALSALSLFLQPQFETITTISNPNLILSEIKKTDYDIVLLDMNFSAGLNTGNEGLFWLKEIKQTAPTTEVVMITAYGDVELAVKALKLGAADFILKPWENEKLLATLKATQKLRKSNLEVESLKTKEKTLKKELIKPRESIVGSSSAMLRVMRLVEKVANTDANVLITGENGTGKELIAREIHQKSHRCSELLVTVDMGAIPENLFESELFGHKKGAFTDAREDRTGKFRLAHQGTLFLDEIGNLPMPLQAKLLVALESRTIIPIGCDKATPIDIRLISATNCQLEDLVEEGQFREDLLYRLNTIRIEIPPLRDREEDIELLATFFLKKYEKKYHKSSLQISSQAISKMRKYHWPGNVRELQHTIEKAVILAESTILKPEDFMFRTVTRTASRTPLTIEDMEKQLIEAALDKHNGNLTAAAQQLGISRQTLYNKLEKYDL